MGAAGFACHPGIGAVGAGRPGLYLVLTSAAIYCCVIAWVTWPSQRSWIVAGIATLFVSMIVYSIHEYTLESFGPGVSGDYPKSGTRAFVTWCVLNLIAALFFIVALVRRSNSQM